MGDLTYPAPSLQPHYRAFIATTGRSAPVPRIGTLPLVVFDTWGSPSEPTTDKRHPLPLSVRIETTGSPVPCQRLRRAHATFTPDTTGATCRQLPSPRHATAHAVIPGVGDNPGFDVIAHYLRCVSSGPHMFVFSSLT